MAALRTVVSWGGPRRRTWPTAQSRRSLAVRMTLFAPDAFAEDAGLCCGGGVNGASDPRLHPVDRLCGREVAIGCFKALLSDMPRTRQSGYVLLPLARPHDDEKVQEIEHHLGAHFARDGSDQRRGKAGEWPVPKPSARRTGCAARGARPRRHAPVRRDRATPRRGSVRPSRRRRHGHHGRAGSRRSRPW